MARWTGENRKRRKEWQRNRERSGRDNNEECERVMRTAINEIRPPSAYAARLHSNIFYFLMKRGDKKKNFSSANITQMWRRRMRGRKRWARRTNFLLVFSRLHLKPERTHLCPHKLNYTLSHSKCVQLLLKPFQVDSCHCEVWVLREVQGSASVCAGPSGQLWHKWVDFSLNRPESWYDQWKWAGCKWEREIDFPFLCKATATLWVQSLMSSPRCTDDHSWRVRKSMR